MESIVNKVLALRTGFYGGLAVVLLALAGCDAGPPDLAVSLRAEQDDRFFIAPALTATAARFFAPAPPPPARHGGAQRPLRVDIDGDTLSGGSDIPYTQPASQQLALTATAQWPLPGRYTLGSGITLARGHSRYVLTQGAGVLVDPITIEFDSDIIGLHSGIIWSGPQVGRIEPQLGAGVGASFSRTRTHIHSALLDVRARSDQGAGFMYTDFGLRLVLPGARARAVDLNSRMKIYPTLGVSFQTGVALNF